MGSTSSRRQSRLQQVAEKLVWRKSRTSQELSISPDMLEHLQRLMPGGSESDAELSAGEDSDPANQTIPSSDRPPSSLPGLRYPSRPSSRQGISQLPTIPHSPSPNFRNTASSSGGYAEFGPSVEGQESVDGVAPDGSNTDLASSSSEKEDEEDCTEEPSASCLSVSGAVLPVRQLPDYHSRDWDGSFLPPSPEMIRRPNPVSLDSMNMSARSSVCSTLDQRLSTESTPQRGPDSSRRRASITEGLSAEVTPERARHERKYSLDYSALPSMQGHSDNKKHRQLSSSILGPLIRTLDLSSNCLESVDGLCDARVYRRLNALKDLDLKHNKLDCLNGDLFKVGWGSGWLLVGGRVGEGVGG